MKKEKKLTSHIADVIAKQTKVPKEEIHIDGLYEYDYVKDDTDDTLTVHILYYSNGIEWSDHIKNTVALAIIDTGNGVVVEDLSVNKEIDYLKLEQLLILLRLQSQSSTFQRLKPLSKVDF